MKKLLIPACLSLMLFGSAAICPADVVLNYTISDASGMASHQKSDSLTGPIGTPVAGGVEYDFAFGPFSNNNWNWSIGSSTVSLILFGPQSGPTGAKLFLSGSTSAKPFTVTYMGPNRTKSDQVEINFSATFSPLAPPLTRSAGLAGDITSMNPRLTVNPTMVATSTGSGNFGTVMFDSTIGPKLEPKAVMGLTGDINFTWNKNLQINGDTVTFSQAYVLVSAVPEPASVVLTVSGAFLGAGAWLFSRRQATA
jgi:hypothetical protein